MPNMAISIGLSIVPLYSSQSPSVEWLYERLYKKKKKFMFPRRSAIV